MSDRARAAVAAFGSRGNSVKLRTIVVIGAAAASVAVFAATYALVSESFSAVAEHQAEDSASAVATASFECLTVLMDRGASLHEMEDFVRRLDGHPGAGRGRQEVRIQGREAATPAVGGVVGADDL